MKKLILYAILITAVSMSGLVPFPRSDTADLKPLQTLTVTRQNGTIVLTGDNLTGVGTTWEHAMADLQQAGDGRVFLQTAEYIILVHTAVDLLPQVLSDSRLRPAAQVCYTRDPVADVEQTGKYLSAHETNVTIGALRTALANGSGAALPVLVQTEGGLRLYAP